jgi:hypothetical protein
MAFSFWPFTIFLSVILCDIAMYDQKAEAKRHCSNEPFKKALCINHTQYRTLQTGIG